MELAFPLTGKRALITGASRGIGQSIAWALAGAGAQIAVAGREIETVEKTANMAEELVCRMTRGARNCQATPIRLDVTSVSSIREGVGHAEQALGGLDLLVNNAGVQQLGPALEVEEETWDTILDTNLKGAFFTAQAAARIMSEGSGGAILNICALSAERGIPLAAPYGCSKSGLLGMTRSLATEWGRYFIRVNALAPGYVHTDMTEKYYLDREWRAEMLDRTPISRLGQPADLQDAAVFLLSDASRFITGACLPVDGGILASL